jgi:hypothetical protein
MLGARTIALRPPKIFQPALRRIGFGAELRRRLAPQQVVRQAVQHRPILAGEEIDMWLLWPRARLKVTTHGPELASSR